MPLFSFLCVVCHHEQEEYTNDRNKTESVCEKCSGRAEKIISLNANLTKKWALSCRGVK